MNRTSTFLTMMTMNDDKISSVENQLRIKCNLLNANLRPMMPNANQLTTELSKMYEKYCLLLKISPRKNKRNDNYKMF